MKTRTIKIFFMLFMVSGLIIPATPFSRAENQVASQTSEIFEEDSPIPGMIEGTGTYFEIKESEYLNITLKSSEEIKVLLESIPEMISLNIEAIANLDFIELTIEGLGPSRTYYRYEDSYKNEAVFISDEKGSYSWNQDLTQPHHIWIQEIKGTTFISEDTVLDHDITGSVEITADDVTLDCNGHSITGENTGYGIYLNNKQGVTVKNCNINNFSYGIYLGSSSHNTLSNNRASFNGNGIYLYYSNHNTLTNNTADSNSYWFGIILHGSNNNTLKSNTVSNFFIGISLNYSRNNTIDSNIASNNNYGIHFVVANDNILTDNKLSENRCNLYLPPRSDTLYNDIDTSNTVDGKPIYYLKNAENEVYDSSTNAGIFYCINCNNVTVKDLTLNSNGWGLLFWNTHNSRIENVDASNNCAVGISLLASSNNILADNTADSNNYPLWGAGGDGIYLGNAYIGGFKSSHHNTLSNNTTNFNKRDGIILVDYWRNNENTLVDNTANSNGRMGIFLGEDNDTFTGNTANSNSHSGIYLLQADSNILTYNTVVSNTGTGFYLRNHSNYNIFEGNTISSNGRGFNLYSSSYNTIINNDILNSWTGINLRQYSYNNKIYHNNFIDNTERPILYLSGSIFDDGYPEGGNYWSDYSGVDEKGGPNQDQLGSDGMGDTPYAFTGGQDRYPSMKKNGWEVPPEPEKWFFDVAVILAEPSDVSYTSSSITTQPCKLIPKKTYSNGHSKEYYQDLAYCVADYHKENSFEAVNLNFTIYDNNGEWFKTDKKEEDYEPRKKEEIFDKEKEFVQDAISTVKNSGIDLSDKDITIVVKAKEKSGPYIMRELHFRGCNFIEVDEITGEVTEFGKIIVGGKDPIGAWSHEIGHVIGVFVTPENTATPDLYKMGNVGKWDLMADGVWNGGPFDILFVLGDGTNPPYMSSFTKEFLGWLNYDIHPKSAYGKYWINSLETSKFGDKVFRYNLSDNTNENSSRYYILETRNRALKTWDSSLPGLTSKHLILYYVDTKGLPKYGYDLEKEKIMVENWTVTIPSNGPGGVNDGVLDPIVNETYRDLDNLVKFSAITDRSINNKYEIQARVEEITYDSFTDKFWGAVLRPKSFLKEKIKGIFHSETPSKFSLASPNPRYLVASEDPKNEDSKTITIVTDKNWDYYVKLSLFKGIKNLSFNLLILLILISLVLLFIEKKSIPKWKSEKRRKIFKAIFRIIWIFTLIVFIVFIAFSLIARYWESKKPTTKDLKTIVSPSPVEPTTLPDLDLHLYCDDGKHIGINYENQEYEIQIPEAIVSGDNQDAPEWIFIPPDIPGCHFVVSSYDNQRFLEENPEIAQGIEDTGDGYEIYARYIDPATDIYTSQILTNQLINPDQNIIHQTQGTTTISVSEGVVDNQGPIISYTKLNQEYILNSAPITFDYSAQDSGVGVFNIEATLDGNPIINGQIIVFDRVGTYTITITASDFLENTATENIIFDVIYQFNGFLPPIKLDSSGIYRLGRTLPVKFQLTDANNYFISTANAYLYLVKIEDSVAGSEEIPLSTSNADTGNKFRYDVESNQYIYNLATDIMTPGSWQLKIALGDDQCHIVFISIRN